MSETKVLAIVSIVALLLLGFYQFDSSSSNPTSKLPTVRQEESILDTATKETKQKITTKIQKQPQIQEISQMQTSPRLYALRVENKQFLNDDSETNPLCTATITKQTDEEVALGITRDPQGPACGCAFAKKFGVEFTLVSESVLRTSNDGVDYKIIVAQVAGNTTDLTFSARAISENNLVGCVPRRLQEAEILSEEFEKVKSRIVAEKRKQVFVGVLSAWEFNFWLQGGEKSTFFEIELTLTWINDKYIGTKWNLPNRDDNPPSEIKKQKCRDLKLIGSCDRFGLPIFKGDAILESSSQRQQNSEKVVYNYYQQSSKPLCKTSSEIAQNGAWQKIPEEIWNKNTSKEERELLDDFVGLNRFRGGVWRWEPRQCSLRWFQREALLKELIEERGIQQITLFGDSMLLEQFHNFKMLLAPDVGLFSKTQNKMRSMSFTASVSSSSSSSTLTVSFIRSYTTKKGQSVIATPSIIARQVAATKPDLVVGNAAVLHWQQNGRRFDEWKSNIEMLAKQMCGLKIGFSQAAKASPHPKLLYWGPTLIQMGRTQGLQPHRTSAFGDVAKEIFERECPSNFFAPFWMYNASISRRESAHDGQHWACYRQWGGVAQTFTQMLFNLVLN